MRLLLIEEPVAYTREHKAVNARFLSGLAFSACSTISDRFACQMFIL